MSKAKLSRRAVLAGLAASPAAMEFLRSAVAEAQTSLSQSGLVGELQGPTIITDPAKWPKKFDEAPMLAELVKAGKLPPVEQRVPAEPLVCQPLHEIGKYGGTWRRGFTGPADGENGNRIQSSDKLLFWNADGSKIVPSVAKGCELSDDGKTLHAVPAQGHEVVRRRAVHRRRLHVLVRGHLQQQGARPDADAGDASARQARQHGQGRRDHRRFEFDEPYSCSWTSWPATPPSAAGRPCARPARSASAPTRRRTTSSSSCRSTRRSRRRTRARSRRASTTGCRCCSSRRTGSSTPTCRCSGPWRTVRPINTPIWMLERNPYFYAVDTEGNQLPYIDKSS